MTKKTNNHRPMVSVGEANVDKMVGILFTGIQGDQLEDTINKLFLMTITTGCKKSYSYSRENFPRQDLKCSCDDEKCWVVKYE